MFEKPSDRPSWEWLHDQAGDKLAYYAAVDENASQNPFPFPHPAPRPRSEHDDEDPMFDGKREWCMRMFGDPPPPPLRNPAGPNGLDAWCNAVVADNTTLSGWRYPNPTVIDLEDVPFLP